MEFVNWYIAVIKKYAEFTGRARRREYWSFVLVNLVIVAVFSLLGNIRGIGGMFSVLSGLYGLAIFCPSLAACIRRLHDIGKPGIHFLVALIPLVGWIILLIWVIKEGVPGSNEYGPDPKAG